MADYDFSGWATKNDRLCADGRTIRKDAFKECDGQTVPLVWSHDHKNMNSVIGHALLENRPEGVYCYGKFNSTDMGRDAKIMVDNGDITSLSIYANRLKQQNGNVLHGSIREVSLVLAGANPGAYIDCVMSHGYESEEEAVIYTGESLSLCHSDDESDKEDKKEMADEKKTPETEEKKEEGKTVKEVFDTLNEEQKTVVYALIGQAIEDAKGGSDDDDDDEDVEHSDYDEEGTDFMKHNVFENDEVMEQDYISHAEMMEVIEDGKRFGSLKESALQHGIENIDYLFPDARNLDTPPSWISRDQGWVKDVMGAVHHTPFSRIKSMHADITEDEARARGYIKGNLKKEEVFGLLKRTTTPTTVYKKQKLDRDDVVDITDFDVVAWLKAEMRLMLDEELARAFLIGDGRPVSSDDKINEQNIRPILSDAELYTIRKDVDTSDAANIIEAAIRARKDYKGKGSPWFFTTEDVLNDLLLIKDLNKRYIYDDEGKLAQKMRVSKIVTVPVMEGAKFEGKDVLGIIVNLGDYNVGADKGGAVSLFDDFDIDYNAQKYLIETRCSGALTTPKSAIVLLAGGAGETPAEKPAG